MHPLFFFFSHIYIYIYCLDININKKNPRGTDVARMQLVYISHFKSYKTYIYGVPASTRLAPTLSQEYYSAINIHPPPLLKPPQIRDPPSHSLDSHFIFCLIFLFFFSFCPVNCGELVRVPVRMALLPDLGTEIVIPVCAVIGIAFSLVQWYLVSLVKVSSDHGRDSAAKSGKNGYSEYLIEEEDGINDQSVVAKCAEIQQAISEGQNSLRSLENLSRS